MADLNYSPEEWLNFLDEQLTIRIPDVDRYERYYRGEHPLAFATSKFREAFGDLFAEFADNFMELVVDVPVDKLHVTGFDFGDEKVNEEAWKLWRLNDMESRARIAHTEAVKCRASYVLVDPVLGRITVEHPKQAYVELDPADPMNRLAGIKRWVGVDGKTYATLYLPDRVYKYVSKGSASNKLMPTLPDHERLQTSGGWDLVREVRNPLGVVPLIPLENNPTLLRGGKSDLEVAIPLQNATNKLVTDMIVASEYQAFKQRVLTGVEVPKYPEGHEQAGQPMPSAELMAAISRTWFIEDTDARVTELGGVDLGNYVQAIEMSIQHIATKTRIPPQHFLSAGGTLANVSTESMTVINDGFISKVERKQGDFGPSWREVMRLALQAKRIQVPKDVTGTTKWAPVQKPSIAALADALAKLQPLGVPFEWIWQQIGATPEEAVEWRKQLDERQKQAPAPSGLVGPNGAPLAPVVAQPDQNPSGAPNAPQAPPQAP